jgi:hypothetical protein
MAVCIITPALPCEQVQLLGMTARNNSKHLGIYLGKIIESTVTETLAKLEPQLIKQKILATTPPTGVLHKATLATVHSFQTTIMSL